MLEKVKDRPGRTRQARHAQECTRRHLLESNPPRPPPLRTRLLLFTTFFITSAAAINYQSEAVIPALIHARHALSHSVQLLRTLTGISSAQAIHVTAGLLVAEAQVSQSASASASASLSSSRSVRDGAHQQPGRISDSPNRGPVLISSFIALHRAFFSLAM